MHSGGAGGGYTISIHVPREGDDNLGVGAEAAPAPISIHVPREGDDLIRVMRFMRTFQFQSTSPVRGTTSDHHIHRHYKSISIHVPREGDDSKTLRCVSGEEYFNPRPP